MHSGICGWLGAVLFVGGTVAWGQDKRSDTLFDPTPRSEMRELSPDRPDTTESPITVDAGHVQFEISFVDYAYNDDAGERTEVLSVLPSNLKVGLFHNVDLQLVFTPYVREEVEDEVEEGFSDDTQLRLKVNIWGNDGPHPQFGDTALAVMPFVKFPTGSGELSNDHIEGGIIVPLSISLPGEWNLGLMAEVDFVFNDARDDYGIQLVHTAVLGHDIPWVDGLAGFIEYVGISPVDTGGTYQAIGSGGLTYALSDDWLLDAGVTVGISDSADDFGVFVGTTFRH